MRSEVKAGQFALLPNGIRLHYASAGEKGRPLLMFVHGFPECWFAWQTQLEEFGQLYFAVAPDLRGFNLSDMPADVASYKPRLIMQDLQQLVASLGYQQCVMVAHDWGGAIAWNIAISNPQLLKKLIIINAPHPYLFAKALVDDNEQKTASAYMNWLRAAGSEQALAKDDFRVMEQLFIGMSDNAGEWLNEVLRKKYHEFWSKGLSGGVNYYRASPLHPATESDPGASGLRLDPAMFSSRIPVRVIWGERDQALRPVLLSGLEQFVADLRIERIANASHWVVHECPQQINHLIGQFLEE